MVKFGEQLASGRVEKWRDNYIDYDLLRDIIVGKLPKSKRDAETIVSSDSAVSSSRSPLLRSASIEVSSPLPKPSRPTFIDRLSSLGTPLIHDDDQSSSSVLVGSPQPIQLLNINSTSPPTLQLPPPIESQRSEFVSASVNEIRDREPQPSSNLDIFQSALEKQLSKVDRFYIATISEIERRYLQTYQDISHCFGANPQLYDDYQELDDNDLKEVCCET